MVIVFLNMEITNVTLGRAPKSMNILLVSYLAGSRGPLSNIHMDIIITAP